MEVFSDLQDRLGFDGTEQLCEGWAEDFAVETLECDQEPVALGSPLRIASDLDLWPGRDHCLKPQRDRALPEAE